MSEKEINEDNCVLDEDEIDLLDIAFGDFMLDIKSKSEKDEIHNQFKKIFLKINNLNEIAKHEMLMEHSRKNEIDLASLLSLLS